jgi:hypothetical protein
MLRYQIETSAVAKAKLAAAGGDGSVAERVFNGIKWTLARDPISGSHLVDAERNIRVIESERRTPGTPIMRILYQIVTSRHYDMLIVDLEVIP